MQLSFWRRHLVLSLLAHTQRPDLLEMADLPHRHHGNFPQRLPAPLPQVSKCRVQLAPEPVSSGTCLDQASAAEESSLPAEHNVSNHVCNGKMPSEQQRLPAPSVAALLKRIRVHPEAQRILGNSCVPVVNLQRLNFQTVSLSSLQPVVSLVRLPRQAQAEILNNVSLNHQQQKGLSQSETDILEIREDSPEPKPAESSDLSPPGTTPTSWTEPYCPDSPPSEEPEQGSGFDCESNLDQPYILLDSASDEWDPDGKTYCETFYLDPDPEHTMVIELDPEADTDQERPLDLQDETQCEADVVQIDEYDDQRPGQCCSQTEDDSSNQQPEHQPELKLEPELEPEPEPEPRTQEVESEDFCAVCLNGGDLLCCDRCPKVYHLACHVPQLLSFPLGEWLCTLCRSDLDPVEAYDCENMHSCGAVKVPYTLSSQDQRRCEKLTLLLFCHLLSAPFHEPVSPLARNYYQIIKRPIDLSVIRRKLDQSNTVHYFSAEQFVDDVLLMFKNCATFNYPDSEVAQAGQNLELFFLSKLKEIFPEKTFPLCSQDGVDRAHLQWLSRKRKEHYRKKRHVFSGKKYYL